MPGFSPLQARTVSHGNTHIRANRRQNGNKTEVKECVQIEEAKKCTPPRCSRVVTKIGNVGTHYSHFTDHVLDFVQRKLVQRELPELVHGKMPRNATLFLRRHRGKKKARRRPTQKTETSWAKRFPLTLGNRVAPPVNFF